MRRERRKSKQNIRQAVYMSPELEEIYITPKPVKPVRPLNESQYEYLKSLENNALTFAIGPAGTGKTYLATAYACELLKSKEIESIIITRPCVESGSKLGALPGELEDKFAPYIAPLVDVFNERLGKSTTAYFLKHGSISAKPLEFIRGSTFKNAFVILDEAQNTTPIQMKLFLTRIGENCRVVVNGDTQQKDIPGASGLVDAINRFHGKPQIQVVKFTEADCVRSGLCKTILIGYRDE